MGFRYDETLGKTFNEQMTHDNTQIQAMSGALGRGREWNGQLTMRRKTQEPIVVSCKAVPVICAGR